MFNVNFMCSSSDHGKAVENGCSVLLEIERHWQFTYLSVNIWQKPDKTVSDSMNQKFSTMKPRKSVDVSVQRPSAKMVEINWPHMILDSRYMGDVDSRSDRSPEESIQFASYRPV
jgi:hypothetical protein